MLAQAPDLPPALERIATTPVLASERPPGFSRVAIVRLPANPRIQSLGIVRFDFSNNLGSESASFALMRSDAAARGLAHTAATYNTGGVFHARAVTVRRFVVAVTATTKAEAADLLARALSHFRRSGR